MQFRPKNDDHAIEVVAFTFTMREPMNEVVVQNVIDKHDLWREVLPAVNTGRGTMINLAPENDLIGANAGLFKAHFAHLRPDGTPTWSLDIAAQNIVLCCFLYTRWERVWRQAQTIIGNVIEAIGSEGHNLSIHEVVFEVVDVFATEESSYDLHSLLTDCDEISPQIFEAGPLWHQHTGWFTPWNDDFQKLNQINFDARRAASVGGETEKEDIIFVSIRHAQRLRPIEQVVLSDLGTDGTKKLDKQMVALHDENKNLLARILVEDMQQRIGLNPGEIL